MTTSVVLCCLAAALATGPRSALTLNGQPLVQAVEIDVLRPTAATLVEPVQDGDQEEPEAAAAPQSRRRTLIGAGIGALIGCAGGTVAGDSDNARWGNCVIWAGIGAAIGAIAGRSSRHP